MIFLRVEPIAKLHAHEKTGILRSVARAGASRPNPADGGLPKGAGEEGGSQLASKGRFCGAKSFAIGSILIPFVFLAACSTPKEKKERCLNISFHIQPATFDPRKSGDFISSTLICLVYEGLARCLSDGTVELALAESVEISEDKRVYTFRLKEAFWTDGRRISAYDFESSWKTILNPKFPSLCPYLLYPIQNGEKCAKGEMDLDQVGVRALNEKTLQITLERPTPYFLSLTAFPVFLPVPSDIDRENPEWEKKLDLIASGPFRIEKMIPNSEIVLVKNESYWNAKNVALDEIHIRIISDETTAFQMFERGMIDWMGAPLSPLPPDALEKLKKRQELQFHPCAATTFCAFNTETFPFSNRHMRKAFSYAINRKEIVEKVTQMGQLPATRCLPPTLFKNQNKALIPSYAPEVARIHFEKGLEELGISKETLNEITLSFKPGQIDKRVAQTLQRHWKKTLGVNVKLQLIDYKTHMHRLHGRDYQISLACWIAQFHDPINILERFKDRHNPKNYPGWENERYSKLLDAASFENDLKARFELLEEAEALLADEMPLAPLYHWSNPSLSSPRLFSLTTTPSGGVLFEKCFVK